MFLKIIKFSFLLEYFQPAPPTAAHSADPIIFKAPLQSVLLPFLPMENMKLLFRRDGRILPQAGSVIVVSKK